MWDISETLEDYSQPNRRNYLKLKSNQPLNPYTISYPIEWKGYLNSNPIKVIQINESSSRTADFNFALLPIEYTGLQGVIARFINSKLRCLD